MSLTFAAVLVLAQAAVAGAEPAPPAATTIAAPATAAPMTGAEARLADCMAIARRDPATAVSDANQWLEGLGGAERALPMQCLGFAYTSLLRWDAAQDAFADARDALGTTDHIGRALLGAMAGNAALAAQEYADALDLLSSARGDALAAGEAEMAGTIEAERARAHVGLGQIDQAEKSLATARTDAPQVSDVWLLSATLARRAGNLVDAQGWIQTAAALSPQDVAIGLEAGVIAALAGYDAAARASWQSVVDTAADSPQAETARAYLAQLDSLEAQ